MNAFMKEIQDINLELTPHVLGGMTKTQVSKCADKSVERVLENGDVLTALEGLAAMELFCETVKKDERFKEYVLQELAKGSGKHESASGTKIEACEVAVSYDYTANSDWKVLDIEIKRLTERRKEIEKKLQRIDAGKLLVDEETGETLVGAPKTSKSSFKVTLAK